LAVTPRLHSLASIADGPPEVVDTLLA